MIMQMTDDAVCLENEDGEEKGRAADHGRH